MQVNVTLPDYEEEKAAAKKGASENGGASAKSGGGTSLKKEEAPAKEDKPAPRLDELKFGQSLKKD